MEYIVEEDLLDINEINKKFIESQNGKNYILYCKEKFYFQLKKNLNLTVLNRLVLPLNRYLKSLNNKMSFFGSPEHVLEGNLEDLEQKQD